MKIYMVKSKKQKKQITQGINAGYDEIMKMSKLLFAPPVIFLILIDPCRRCSFCRALLSFIQHNTNKLTSEVYKDFPFMVGPVYHEKERYWYELLSSTDQKSVCTHFITMGLHKQVVENDLKQIGMDQDLQLLDEEPLP